MSDSKKDLTRIEDLGEFIHELNNDEEFLPDLPSSDEEEAPAFDSESSFESSSFETNNEETSSGLDFGTTEEFSTSDFTTSFEMPTSTEEETPALDFGTTEEFPAATDEFKTEEFKTEEFKTEEEPSWNTDVPLTQEIEKTPEPEIAPEPEPVFVAPEPVLSKEPEYKTPETFEDLKKFSESSSFGGMATEGNPSFSVLLKNVRYIEDVHDIVTLLKELNLLVDGEDQTKSRLMRGMLLVPRISEYAAIFLSHKLRRFDIDIQVGLSDEIHPPKHQETPETGIVSKHSLFQNQSHYFHFDDPKLDISQIILSATSQLEGHQVVKYMGVASEHKMLDSGIVEDENSSEVPAHYQELAQKLKAHALKANANAVVGLNYQLTPIPSEYGMSGHKYRLTCTGNLVWVNKL